MGKTEKDGKMALKEKIDYVAFLKKVKECRGEVILKTNQGDVLNLASVLSGYVMIFLSSKEDALKDAWIECSVPADAEVLKEFLVCV